MMILAGRTISSALRTPYPYGGEFVSQFIFVIRLAWFPMLISTLAFSYGDAPYFGDVASTIPGYPGRVVGIAASPG